MIFYSDENSKLICADVRQGLKSLPHESVHCCVTSPPYWGLRCYNSVPQIWGGDPACQHEWKKTSPPRIRKESDIKDKESKQATNPACVFNSEDAAGNFCCKCWAWLGELGLEPTPELFVEHLVLVFREVWRVLRTDGTLWLNLGDSFISGKSRYSSNPQTISGKHRGEPDDGNKPDLYYHPFLKDKDLAMIPARAAIALQEDGWYLRNDICWSKGNPMPESVKDRCTKSYEHIFLMSKSPKYFFDHIAIQEPAAYDGRSKLGFDGSVKYANGFVPEQNPQSFHLRGHDRWQWDDDGIARRNKRDVWQINTRPYSGAHYATFPKELPETCIKAGTSEKGCCEKCGKPYERIFEKRNAVFSRREHKSEESFYTRKKDSDTKFDIKIQTAGRLSLLRDAARDNGGEYIQSVKTTGWQPTCDCGAGIIPCTVLDPFSGAGTTWLAARELGRRFTGVEINEKDCDLAKTRVLTETGVIAPPVKEDDTQMRLFI